MLPPSLTHYAPWNEHDGERARCGARVHHDTDHSLTPTCPVCAVSLAAEEAATNARQREVIVAEQRACLARYHAAYERWLAYAGPKPCRETCEEELAELDADLAAWDAACAEEAQA